MIKGMFFTLFCPNNVQIGHDREVLTFIFLCVIVILTVIHHRFYSKPGRGPASGMLCRALPQLINRPDISYLRLTPGSLGLSVYLWCLLPLIYSVYIFLTEEEHYEHTDH